jgi:type IV secretion system protein VirB2
LHISASFGGSLADPAGSSVIVASVAWLEGTLLGTLATTTAIIAVASVGYMSLSGRLNIRHGATVISDAL